MLVSSLYFRTLTNVGLQEEVHEERSDDNDDDKVDTASESHTVSPSLSTSTVSKRKKSESSDLCATLTKLIASRDKLDSEHTTKKKLLTVYT